MSPADASLVARHDGSRDWNGVPRTKLVVALGYQPVVDHNCGDLKNRVL
jgi:hypothetical protein